jgi:hypothetical protein
MPNGQETAMLQREVEWLMRERSALLRICGAAAVFVEDLDSRLLPASSWNAADMLAEALNALPEDSLRDALESLRTQNMG